MHHWHLIPIKERKAKDISDLLRKKKQVVVGKREKDTLKRNCRKYMGWIFKHAFEQVRKRSFIREAIKNEVSLKNLQANPKIMKMLPHIDN